MRDVYAAQFLLTAEGAFERAQQAITTWALERYSDAPLADPSGPMRVAINSTDSIEWGLVSADSPEGRRAWSLTLQHADHDDSSLMWRALAQLTEHEGSIRFTFRLAQLSLGPRVTPALDVPGRPRIVRDLAQQLGGLVDGLDLAVRYRVVRSDDIPDLVRLLISPARRLPVVVTTVAQETGRATTDAETLGNHLVGIAHAYAIATALATYELTEQLGRRFSVFDGAVRIYWPGFLPDADPYVHRLWLARTVEAIDERAVLNGRRVGFARHLLGMVGDVAALRISPDPVARAYQREAEARSRAAEREEWSRLVAEQASTIPDVFAEEFDRQASRIEELELELEVSEEERSRLESDVQRMARSFADVQAAVALERGDVGSPTDTPTTVLEALRAVATDHPDALIVLDDAYESAVQTGYPQIDRATAALRAVGAVAQGWRDGTLGMSFDDAFREQGFELRSVSTVTRGRYPSEYERRYQGHRVFLGPHLALGSGGSTDTILRIYWYLDEGERCFVVGHVGRHLTDSST